MNHLLLLCVLPLTAPIGQAMLPADKPLAENQDDLARWKLVWSDEFNYTGLPNPEKWGYEKGFVRNKESQYYTEARTENARVEDGVLVLEARKESFTTSEGIKADYTAASLTTAKTANWRYGRFEMRAKLPKGRGIWPAFWMLGISREKGAVWPNFGEIDIMEYVGQVPDTIYATIHYAKIEEGQSKPQHKKIGGEYKTQEPFNHFHVYACEWSANRIDFFFDNIKYKTIEVDQAGIGEANAFREPFYILVNFALGGSWGGVIDDSVLPQKYLIDYVRVYEAIK